MTLMQPSSARPKNAIMEGRLACTCGPKHQIKAAIAQVNAVGTPWTGKSTIVNADIRQQEP